MRPVRAPTVVAVAAALVMSGCLGSSGPGAPTSGESSASGTMETQDNVTRVDAAPTGPDWVFTDTDGVGHSRDSAAGLPSVLFFMASWCSSCKSKTGVLAKVNSTYWPQGLQTFTLSFDTTDDDESLRTWKAKYNQPWPHGIDRGFEMQKAFGINSQSSVVVLDHAGEVVKKFGYGAVTEETLKEAVETAFGRAGVDD